MRTPCFPLSLLLAAVILALGASAAGCGDDASDPASDTALTDVAPTDAADADAFIDTAPPAPVCGDGRIEADEACDDDNVAGLDCATALDTEHAIGRVRCAACALDLTACEAVTCAPGEAFVGGGCAPAVSVDAYVPSGVYSYVRAIDLAPTQPPCCGDLDGDGTLDNALKDLLGGLVAIGTGGLDLSDAMNTAIETGQVAMVFEYRVLPEDLDAGGPAAFSFYSATNDLDGDGNADQASAVRFAGDGVYRLDRDAFGPHGALTQLNRGQVAAGTLVAEPAVFHLDVVVPDLFTLRLAIDHARLELDLRRAATGIFSVDETVEVAGEPVVIGGARLSGMVTIATLTDVINALARDCSCAGLTPGTTLMTVEETSSRVVLECDPAVAFDDTSCTADPAAGGGFLCTQLTLLCAAPTVLRAMLDVDSNGNGVNDAFSAAVRMELVGAALADPPITAP